MNDSEPDGMSFCAGLAPSWADEVRHPDMNSTEFWRGVAVVRSEDFNEDFVVALVQNGPSALEQVSIGGIRFAAPEAQAVAAALNTALALVGGEGGPRPSDLPGANRGGGLSS